MSRKQNEQRALDIVAGRNSAPVRRTETGTSAMTWVGFGLWGIVLLAGGSLAAFMFIFQGH